MCAQPLEGNHFHRGAQPRQLIVCGLLTADPALGNDALTAELAELRAAAAATL